MKIPRREKEALKSFGRCREARGKTFECSRTSWRKRRRPLKVTVKNDGVGEAVRHRTSQGKVGDGRGEGNVLNTVNLIIMGRSSYK